mmetsp:Transcript_5096/g.5549  ORF Transcript_5096/g.5549 Transcript_5096/m.5549 type:complete len:347 (-) Transcript_5096:73-1113(-)
MDVQDDVLYTGWVEKKGALRRNWTKRMLVLKKHHLLYYADKNMRDEKGRIPLREIRKARFGLERKKRRMFFVDATSRTYSILVNGDEAAQLWVEKINAAASENASLRENTVIQKSHSRRRPAKKNYAKKAHTMRASRSCTASSGSGSTLGSATGMPGRSRTVGSQCEYVDEDYAPLPSRYNTAPVEAFMELQTKRRLSTGGSTSLQSTSPETSTGSKKKKTSRDSTPKGKRKGHAMKKRSPITSRRGKKQVVENYAVAPTFFEESSEDYAVLPLFPSESSSEDLDLISPLRPKSRALIDSGFYTPLPNVLDSEEEQSYSIGTLSRQVYSAYKDDDDDGYACLPPPM